MFTLSDAPIDAARLSADFADQGAGAVVFFEGRVRNRNEGRSVVRLHYEGAAEIASSEFARIEAELRETYAIIDVVCVHRVGTLRIGETAVWVGVLAGHRDAAFAACRAAIDEAKARLPIWKKEEYEDGTSGWINHP